MGRLSVIINTLNEEENIKRAILSVKDFADEVVVVDMHSDDDTASVAKRLGAQVFQHERAGYVEPARNFAVSKAKGDWILILDADEEISEKLRSKLKEIVNNQGSVDFYRLARKSIIFGKWIRHSRWWPDYNIRLFKRGSVVWDSKIHSVPITTGTGADLEADEKLAIIHHHYDSVSQYLVRLNRYTDIQSSEVFKNGRQFVWSDLIRRPAAEFFGRYFAGEGYKDGLHGLGLSLLQAFSELVVVLKLWELNKFDEKEIKIENVLTELSSVKSDFNYWKADTLVKNTHRWWQVVRRKLRL